MATTNNGNGTQQGRGMAGTSGTNTTQPGNNTPSNPTPNRITPNRVAPNITSIYKIYGTNEPYSGRTVEVGGQLYTTVGGALEGNSYQVIANTTTQNRNQRVVLTSEPGTGGNQVNASQGSILDDNQVMTQPRDPNKNYDGGSSY